MRVENMTDMVALIDRKQCDLHKIEEALDYDRALVKSFSDRMKTRLQWRSDLSNFDEEKCKLKEACSQLGDGYMVFFCKYFFEFFTEI